MPSDIAPKPAPPQPVLKYPPPYRFWVDTRGQLLIERPSKQEGTAGNMDIPTKAELATVLPGFEVRVEDITTAELLPVRLLPVTSGAWSPVQDEVKPTTTGSALAKQVGGSHYKGDVIQHVEYCQRNRIPWCESAAIKYIVRHAKKNKAQDVQKAIHYLELLLQIEYPDAYRDYLLEQQGQRPA